MKKIIGLTIAVICTVFLFLPFSVETAFADNSYSVVLNIEGDTYNQAVKVAGNKLLKIGTSFYKFVESKLNAGIDGEAILNYISPNLGTAFYNELSKREIQPVNAELSVDNKNWKFNYTAGKKGIVFDRCQACLSLAKALDGQKQSLKLIEKDPDVTLKDLKRRTALMGSYTTSISWSTNERKHNIALAGSFMHGYVLKSGEEFSFNSIVGERTVERGFKNAKVIADGEYIDGIGGGVCQLATTLYNAVLFSGLKVKKVSRHTFKPGYVPASRDAMVSSYSDFCFENNTDYDIYIFAKANKDVVTVSLYGLKTYSVTLESVLLENIPFEAVDKSGNVLQDTTDRTLITNGIEGVKSELYVIKNGERIRVRSDIYKTKNAVYE